MGEGSKPGTIHRVRIAENRDEPRLVARLAALAGVPERDAEHLLLRAGERLCELPGLKRPPLRISSGGSVRVEGVAGLLRLSARLELEIVPKFLAGTDPQWRQDFFRLALLSRSGRLLPREQLRAGYADRGDLASLVGRTMAQLYWESHRRPLREYRRHTVHEYAIVGDLDPTGIALPEADGFRQTRLAFDRVNDWNAVIHSAVGALAPEVQDGETRQQLLRVQQALAPQRTVRSAEHRALPSRYRHWQPLYDLSVEVLNGFGLGYDERHLHAPGYLMVTWSTWQHLCELALRVGLAPMEVHAEARFPLGDRDGAPLRVAPDVALGDRNAPVALADAKYRTRMAGKPAVANSDIYESLAFLRASGTTRMTLLYPRPASDGSPQPVGTVTRFQTVSVGEQRIDAVLVECRGIGGPGGFAAFGERLAAAVREPAPAG